MEVKAGEIFTRQQRIKDTALLERGGSLGVDAFFCAEVYKKRTACSDRQNNNPMVL